MKKQKMLISIFFAFVIFFSFPFFSFADMADETFTVRLNEKPFEITMLNEPYLTEYTPFIFTNYNDFSLVPDFLMEDFEYTEGSLYIRNNITKESHLLLEEVNDFGALNQRIYAIINKEQIGYVDLETSQYIELWNSKNADLHRILVSADHIYFADGDTIYRMLPSGDNVETIATFDGMQTYYPLSNYRVSWVNAQGDCFVYHLDTGVQESYPTYESMLASAFPSDDPKSRENELLVVQNDISFPLSEYPEGSYFNRFKTKACTCHTTSYECGYGTCDCTYYANGIQCFAFARYAFDAYSHTLNNSIWSNISGHNLLLQNSAVAPSTYTVGTYIRDTTSKGHSMIIKANNGSSLTLYECNYSGRCKVSTRTVSYAAFTAQYSNITQVVQHSWSNMGVYYNNRYHKINCSISGCSGYLLQPHTGTNCTKCVEYITPESVIFSEK